MFTYLFVQVVDVVRSDEVLQLFLVLFVFLGDGYGDGRVVQEVVHHRVADSTCVIKS